MVQPKSVDNERTGGAGRDSRTRLARPNSQARTGTGKYSFVCSADHVQDLMESLWSGQGLLRERWCCARSWWMLTVLTGLIAGDTGNLVVLSSLSCCCCCFSHSAYWLPTRKKLLYTVANPARASWSAEQGKKRKKEKKSGSAPSPPLRALLVRRK